MHIKLHTHSQSVCSHTVHKRTEPPQIKGTHCKATMSNTLNVSEQVQIGLIPRAHCTWECQCSVQCVHQYCKCAYTKILTCTIYSPISNICDGFSKFLQFLCIKGATRKILTSHIVINVMSIPCDEIQLGRVQTNLALSRKITSHLQLAKLFNLSCHHQNKPHAGWLEKNVKTGNDRIYEKCGLIIRICQPVVALSCFSEIKTTSVKNPINFTNCFSISKRLQNQVFLIATIIKNIPEGTD